MKKIIIRIGVVILILVVVALGVVFLSLNSIVKKGVETVGPMITKVDVKLAAAAISPFSGSGELLKFDVGNPPGYTSSNSIKIGDIKLGISPGSLLSDPLVVNEISVKDAEITFEGSFTGNNLSKILDNLKGSDAQTNTAPVTPAEKKAAKKLIVKDFLIEGAKVNVILTLPGGKTVAVPSIPIPTIHLQNIGAAENGVTASQLSQTVLKEILSEATQAASKAAGDIGGQLENLGKSGAEKAKKGISNLFKRN